MAWYWYLLILVIVILVLWWALRRNAKATEVPKHEEEQEKTSDMPAEEFPMKTESEVPVIAEAKQMDDLEVIEGIGPKIAAVLREAGITTFRQLAQEEPGNIKNILEKADLHLADPASWPEQARLAAEGNQAGLKTLQEQLKGGRIVK